MMQKTNSGKMERAIQDLLSGNSVVWVDDGYVDMSVFAEYPKSKEGVAVYEPIFQGGRFTEPCYIRFYRTPKGISMELATKREYEEQEKERIGHLLRRHDEE